MSRSLNRVELLGHLGKDADVKYTPNGVQVAGLSIATSRRWKDKKSDEWKEATDWHRCILWRCEKVAQFLTKGKQVFVTGRLQTRSYDHEGSTRYATEVILDELILLGGGAASAVSSGPAPSDHEVTDDDVPF